MRQPPFKTLLLYLAMWLGISIAYSLTWLTDFAALHDRNPQ